MALNTIDNWFAADGSTGTLKLYEGDGFNGAPVGYTSSHYGKTWEKDSVFDPSGVDTGIALSVETAGFGAAKAGGLNVEFDQEIIGLVLDWRGGSNSRYSKISINGEEVNLQEYVDQGLITIVSDGEPYSISTGKESSNIKAGWIEGNTSDAYNSIQLILNVPVTSVGIEGYGSVSSFTTEEHIWDVGFNENTSLASVCIAEGAMILTPYGEVAIEDIKVGDLIQTVDRGAQKVRWIGHSHVLFGDEQDQRRPIVIEKDAFSKGVPARETRVSPLHNLLINSVISKRMFGSHEVLVASKKLAGIKEGFYVDRERDHVTYYHILFDHHELITANGMQTESLRLSEYSLKRISAEDKKHIEDTMPELFVNHEKNPPVRPVLMRRADIKELIARHVKNEKPLYVKGYMGFNSPVMHCAQ